MRALSLRQASRCETAQHAKCRCRCGGALHGAKRMIEPDDRVAYELLPEDDPHHLRSDEEKKRRRKIKRAAARAPLQETLWPALEG